MRSRGVVRARERMLAAWLVTAVVLVVGAPILANQSSEQEWEVLEQRPAEGEQCLVCRQLIHDGDIVEVRYKGRTFHVAAKMIDDFKADPDRYFYAMQARSGLFDEASVESPPMSMGWLGFGLYVLVGLVFGAICAYAALNRGEPAATWFLAGLVANVVAAALFYATKRGAVRTESLAPGLAKIPTTSQPLPCPACGESNHPTAAACSRCGAGLSPTSEPETARA